MAYEFYLTTQEIFWTHNSEWKPSPELFDYKYRHKNWTKAPKCSVNFVDTFTISVVLPKNNYTMLKIVDTSKQTDKVKFYVLKAKLMEMNGGYLYEGTLDVWCTYGLDFVKWSYDKEYSVLVKRFLNNNIMKNYYKNMWGSQDPYFNFKGLTKVVASDDMDNITLDYPTFWKFKDNNRYFNSSGGMPSYTYTPKEIEYVKIDGINYHKTGKIYVFQDDNGKYHCLWTRPREIHNQNNYQILSYAEEFIDTNIIKGYKDNANYYANKLIGIFNDTGFVRYMQHGGNPVNILYGSGNDDIWCMYRVKGLVAGNEPTEGSGFILGFCISPENIKIIDPTKGHTDKRGVQGWYPAVYNRTFVGAYASYFHYSHPRLPRPPLSGCQSGTRDFSRSYFATIPINPNYWKANFIFKYNEDLPILNYYNFSNILFYETRFPIWPVISSVTGGLSYPQGLGYNGFMTFSGSNISIVSNISNITSYINMESTIPCATSGYNEFLLNNQANFNTSLQIANDQKLVATIGAVGSLVDTTINAVGYGMTGNLMKTGMDLVKNGAVGNIVAGTGTGLGGIIGAGANLLSAQNIYKHEEMRINAQKTDAKASSRATNILPQNINDGLNQKYANNYHGWLDTSNDSKNWAGIVVEMPIYPNDVNFYNSLNWNVGMKADFNVKLKDVFYEFLNPYQIWGYSSDSIPKYFYLNARHTYIENNVVLPINAFIFFQIELEDWIYKKYKTNYTIEELTALKTIFESGVRMWFRPPSYMNYQIIEGNYNNLILSELCHRFGCNLLNSCFYRFSGTIKIMLGDYFFMNLITSNSVSTFKPSGINTKTITLSNGRFISTTLPTKKLEMEIMLNDSDKLTDYQYDIRDLITDDLMLKLEQMELENEPTTETCEPQNEPNNNQSSSRVRRTQRKTTKTKRDNKK